jgi:hypothetical protein
MFSISKNIKGVLCRNKGQCCSITELKPSACLLGAKCMDPMCIFIHPSEITEKYISRYEYWSKSPSKWWLKTGTAIVGPFDLKRMHESTQAFRRSDIDIGISPVGPFRPFSIVYPDHTKAFLSGPDPAVWGIRPAIRSSRFAHSVSVDSNMLSKYTAAGETESDDMELYGLLMVSETKPPPPPPLPESTKSTTTISRVRFVSGISMNPKPKPRRMKDDESMKMVNKQINIEYNLRGWDW